MAAEFHAKQIRKIQKRLSGEKLSIESAVERFEELPDVRAHAHEYLDAILREKYEHGGFEELGWVLQFLRALLRINPDYTLHGCWVLNQVDTQLITSYHRHHSLALPFFIYGLTGELMGTPFKGRADQFWMEWFVPSVQAIVLSQNIHIESIANHETLYSPADDLKHDSQRRHAFTWNEPWTPAPSELEAQWRLIPGNEAKTWFHIANARYPGEYLYASDKRHDGCHFGGHFAFSWCEGRPGGEDDEYQARWELHAFSRDVFALYNPKYRVYLYASNEMRDHQRRFVLTTRDHGNLEVDRKWIFRACLQ